MTHQPLRPLQHYAVRIKQPRTDHISIRIRALTHVALAIGKVVQRHIVAEFAETFAPVEVIHRVCRCSFRQDAIPDGIIEGIARGLPGHGERNARSKSIVYEFGGQSKDGGLDQLPGAVVAKRAHGDALRVFGQHLAAMRPGVGVGATVTHGAVGEAVGGVEGVGGNDGAAQRRCTGHRGAVAYGVVVIGEGLTGGVLGVDQVVERIIGIADAARDAADSLGDVGAVAHCVEGVGVARQDGCPARVEEGGEASGGVVDVRGLDAVGEGGGDQAAGGIIAVGGGAGGPVGDADEAVVGVEGVVRGGGLRVAGDGEGGAVVYTTCRKSASSCCKSTNLAPCSSASARAASVNPARAKKA